MGVAGSGAVVWLLLAVVRVLWSLLLLAGGAAASVLLRRASRLVGGSLLAPAMGALGLAMSSFCITPAFWSVPSFTCAFAPVPAVPWALVLVCMAVAVGVPCVGGARAAPVPGVLVVAAVAAVPYVPVSRFALRLAVVHEILVVVQRGGETLKD